MTFMKRWLRPCRPVQKVFSPDCCQASIIHLWATKFFPELWGAGKGMKQQRGGVREGFRCCPCACHTQPWALLYSEQGTAELRGLFTEKRGVGQLLSRLLLSWKIDNCFFFLEPSFPSLEPFSDSVQAPELLLPHILYLVVVLWVYTAHFLEATGRGKSWQQSSAKFFPLSTEEWEN